MSARGSRKKRCMKRSLFAGRTTAPCCFCGTRLTMTTATLEHVLPLSDGGGWKPDNLRLSCSPCNHDRDTQDFHEYRAKMKGVMART